MPSPDKRLRLLAAHARCQHALFTRTQALAAGFPQSTIDERIASGAWREVRPGVLVACPAVLTPQQLILAEALSLDGVACRESAAFLYGWLDTAPGPPQVLMRTGHRSHRRTREGVASTKDLAPGDVAVVQNIPATSPIRTIIDLGGRLLGEDFVRLVDRAVTSGTVKPWRLERRARELRAPRRNGCARVLHLLTESHPDLAAARNEWEAEVLRLAHRHGLPDPVPNHVVRSGGHVRIIDVAWPEQMVAVEFDGYRWHGGRASFDDGAARQNDLVADGWQPFRLTSTALRGNASPAFGPVAAALLRSDPK